MITPAAYDLTRYSEQLRLLREVRGYLETCRNEHHGTDREGRRFAVDALFSLLDGSYEILISKRVPSVDERGITP